MYRSDGRTMLDVARENPEQYFMMYTNGTLIDDEMARALAEAGNVTPAISVEGWQPQTDARRGAGVFEKIHRAMRLLREHGVPFGVSMTATRENAETVLSDELIDHYFREEGGIYGWIFQYMPIGRGSTLELMVTPEQRRRMLEKELHLVSDLDVFLVDFWNSGPMSLGCISAGRPGGYCYVDWNGNVAPSVFFPYSVANVGALHAAGQPLSSVLDTPCFRSIRAWQEQYRRDGGRVHNLFRPCPIGDHYQFARETIQRHQARAMDDQAARALADPEYRRGMVEYDGRVAELLDPLWEKEIYGCGSATPPPVATDREPPAPPAA
jgi:MoaA/NifB/PqqE/SkfB family radical SAM enzyme